MSSPAANRTSGLAAFVPPDVPEERARTAIHEAGHAVAAWELGLRLDLVTIRPDHDAGGERLGHIDHDVGSLGRAGTDLASYPDIDHLWAAVLARDWDEVTQALAQPMRHGLLDVQRNIVVCLAGPAAEAAVFGDVPEGADDQDEADLRRLTRLCCANRREARLLVRWLAAVTRRLVRRPDLAAMIRALALELLAVETLDGGDAWDLMDRLAQPGAP